MSRIVLLDPISHENTVWDFRVNLAELRLQPGRDGTPKIKSLAIVKNNALSDHRSYRLELGSQLLPSNRVLKRKEADRYLHLSVEALRSFPDMKMSAVGDYLTEVITKGIRINGQTYYFFGHSNSQLKSRSCILIRETSNEAVDRTVMTLGDFGKIKPAAKRAKRIALLFSSDKGGLPLDPKMVKDIPDIMASDGTSEMSDGCGLVSFEFARALAKTFDIHFEGKLYVPSVMQIRYLGYKGVVCVSEQLDQENNRRTQGTTKIHAHLRKSMKKFNALPEAGNTFSIHGYSKPFSYGRLNSEFATLLSALKIPNETFVQKQKHHLDMVANATTDIHSAIVLLSTQDKLDLVQSLAIRGLEDLKVQRALRSYQKDEFEKAVDKKGEERVRVTIENSRLLYGVCDEQGVLKEGEVYVRVNIPRRGALTLTGVDVIVVRNPCLHPGDILKLRAVNKPGDYGTKREECLVFSGIGKRMPASMSSGGDLDGDKFFVCWDKDLIPSTISESYGYPAAKQRASDTVTRVNLIEHFARFNSASVGRVKNLYLRWLRLNEKGAMSPECQELNALHSDCVDGARVYVPERLQATPNPPEGFKFILDVIRDFVKDYIAELAQRGAEEPLPDSVGRVAVPTDEQGMLDLLTSESLAMSEYSRLQLMFRYCTQTQTSPKGFFPYINWDALTTSERYMVEDILLPFYETGPVIWNSLKQSDILRKSDLALHNLHGPIRLQRFYSSKEGGLHNFFRQLEVAVKSFQRMLIVIKIDARFSVIIYKSSPSEWDDNSHVGSGVRVLSITDTASLGRHAATTVSTSVLYTGPGIFQLYAPVSSKKRQVGPRKTTAPVNERGDTFVFLVKAAGRDAESDVQASIAVGKIDQQIQKHVGRVRRENVLAIEIHVISNRDRVGHQILDLSLAFVPTEEIVRRVEKKPLPFQKRSLSKLLKDEWDALPDYFAFTMRDSRWSEANDLQSVEIRQLVNFGISHNALPKVFELIRHLLQQKGLSIVGLVVTIMNEDLPILSIILVQWAFQPTQSTETRSLKRWGKDIIRAVIRSANSSLDFGAFILENRLADVVLGLPSSDVIDLMWLSALSIRPPELSKEFVFHLQSIASRNAANSREYVLRQACAVSIEYAGQVREECRCDDNGVPRSKPMNQLVEPKIKSSSELTMDYRIDAQFPARQGDHVRLRLASSSRVDLDRTDVFDCIVRSSSKGSITLQALHVLPTFVEESSWQVHMCGSTATAKAEIDAIKTLAEEGPEATSLHNVLCSSNDDIPPLISLDEPETLPEMNPSQVEAIHAVQRSRMTLIWGPPGTGKTKVVVQILAYLLRVTDSDEKLLLAASTHNAVDNVLERFLKLRVIDDSLVVRAATDIQKVAPSVRQFAVNAFEHDTPHGREQSAKALEKIKTARIVFSTCAGAGLGLVRKLNFGVVVVDEASQVVESVTLIPLVKGCHRAVLVGDHVQLRPNVTPPALAVNHDRSLFERLYDEPESFEVSKSMLDTQYRFGSALAAFPSKQFYQNKLQTGIPDVERQLPASGFPWPMERYGVPVASPHPCVFIQCDVEESRGSSSKKNDGQIEVVKTLVNSLHMAPAHRGQSPSQPKKLSIVLLSGYSRQTKALGALSLPDCEASTIDGVQGREYDIVIFSTVRCNVEGEIGFMDDARRLNVAWTRARYGRIIIGDRKTLEGRALESYKLEKDTLERHTLWKKALDDCEEVVLPEST